MWGEGHDRKDSEAGRVTRRKPADAHDAAARVQELGDDGANDLFVSDVIRAGELQAWFVAEHLVDTALVHT